MSIFESLDYTFPKYHELCEAMVNNYSVLTFEQYITSQKLPDKYIVLRHDNDRNPENALKMAEIENKYGIKSTYYFRSIDSVFKPKIIKEIYSMGHEIGYHYETLADADGNYKKAIQLFEHNLKKFQQICNVKTICMHGKALSKHDNRDLWKKYDYSTFNIIAEAYLSASSDLNYLSDTGRSWTQKNSLRDFLPGNQSYIDIETTDDLIELINGSDFNNLYLLTHPERWSSNYIEWIQFYILDNCFNFGKKILKLTRR